MQQQQSYQKQLCCPLCNLRFNKGLRLPIFMMCCRQTACENCVFSKMCQFSTRSEDGMIPPEAKFKCSLCLGKIYAPAGVEKHLAISVNEVVLNMLDTSKHKLPVFCDAFPEKHVSWYSKATKTLISNMKLIQQAQNYEQCIPFTKERIDNFFEKSKESLIKLNDLLTQAFNQVVQYLNDDMPNMKGSEFFKIVSKINKLTLCQDEFDEESKHQESFEYLFNEIQIRVPDPPAKVIQDSGLDSKLIQTKKELELINSWFDGQEIKLERIYRGTVDGFTGMSYDGKCESIDHIISVIESEKGNKFGAYKSIKWHQYQQWFQDSKAFIFSLTNQTKLPLINKEDRYGFYHNEGDRIMQFGNGGNLLIANNCDQNYKSRSNIGNTYQAPKGIEFNSDQAMSYLAGSFNFKVKEVEAFRVIFV